jgi:UPF0271 protein
MPININCDAGEGIGNDHLLIPFIHWANIACGYHAGDAETIKSTMELCARHHVVIGAHPSFYNRTNFGRKEIDLSPLEIYDLVTQQLYLFKELADMVNEGIRHVKPHGALYNMSARDPAIAGAIASAIKDFDSKLVLVGLSGSHSIEAARSIGLTIAREAFADRSYQDDGSLTSRSITGAVLDELQATKQVLQLLKESTVTTITGKEIPLEADTICIHGDGPNAVAIAKAVSSILNTERAHTD